MIASRRRFLFGAGASLLAAPAIVRVAANLMPVKPLRLGASLDFTSADLALSVEHWTEQFLKPQMIRLANEIDAAIMAELRRNESVLLS